MIRKRILFSLLILFSWTFAAQGNEIESERLLGQAIADYYANRLTEASVKFELITQGPPRNFMAHYYYGLVLRDLGRHRLAAKELRRALEVNATHAIALRNYGIMLFKIGEDEDALVALNSAVDYYRKQYGREYGDALYFIGRIQFRQKKFKESERVLRRVFRLYPNHQEVPRYLGKIIANRKEYKQATEFFQRAYDNGNKDTSMLLEWALAYEAGGNLPGAHDIAESLVKFSPRNKEYRSIHERISQKIKKIDNRIAVLKSNPRSADGWVELASLYKKKLDINNALSSLLSAINAGPGNVDPYIDYGLTMRAAGKPAASVAIMRKGLDRFPANIRLRETLADNLAYGKKYTEACKEYEQILEIDPDHKNIRGKLGLMYFEGGNESRAEYVLKLCIEREERDVSCYVNLSRQYGISEQYEKAESILAKFTSRFDDVPEAQVNLGHIYRRQRRYREAVIAYDKALELNPEEENAMLGLGMTYHDTRDYKKSLSYFARCVQMRHDNYIASFYIGKIHALRTEVRTAQNIFRSIYNSRSAPIDVKDEARKAEWGLRGYYLDPPPFDWNDSKSFTSEEAVHRSIVKIDTFFSNGVKRAGYGIIVERKFSEIRILTAAEMSNFDSNNNIPPSIRVTFFSNPPDGQERLFRWAYVVESSWRKGVSLLAARNHPENIAAVEWRSTKTNELENVSLFCGSDWQMHKARVSGLSEHKDLQLSGLKNRSGCIGSPVIDREGKVLGILIQENPKSGLVHGLNHTLVRFILDAWSDRIL